MSAMRRDDRPGVHRKGVEQEMRTILKITWGILLAFTLFWVGIYMGAQSRRTYIFNRLKYVGKYYYETIEDAEKYLKTLDPKGGVEIFEGSDYMNFIVRVGPSYIVTDEVKAEVERLLDIKYIEKIVPGLSGLE